MHWLMYYGKGFITLAEIQTFEKVIDDYKPEKVVELATASYIVGDGSPMVLLGAIRQNKVKELFASLPDVSSMDKKSQENFDKCRTAFIDAISSTCVPHPVS